MDIDIDADGAANDRFESHGGSGYVLASGQDLEVDAYSTSSLGEEWRFIDTLTNNYINIGRGYTFPQPDIADASNPPVISADNYARVYGRVYRASEDIGWTAISRGAPYGNLETMEGNDNLAWWETSYGSGGVAANGGAWYAAGLSLVPSWTNPLPDLIIDSVSVDRGYFSAIIKNQGTAVTDTSQSIGVGFYVDGIYKNWSSLRVLGAGLTNKVTTETPSLIPDGNHTVTAIVDIQNRFIESNETNNQLTKPIVLSGPDTTPPYVTITSPQDSATVSGSTVVLSAKAFDNVAIKDVVFFLKDQNSAPDGYGQAISVPKRYSPYVFSWDSTTVTEGRYLITARARDTAGNEFYNTLGVQVATPATIQRPDISVTALSYANGIFSCTIKNIGTATIPTGAWQGLSYWVDGVYKTWTSTYGPLAPGASITLGTSGASYTIPSGTHTIKVVADDQSTIMEANETNNQLSQTITVP